MTRLGVSLTRCCAAIGVIPGAGTSGSMPPSSIPAHGRNWAGKGIDGHHPIFAPSRGKVKGARGRLFIIGVDTMHAVVDEPQSFRPSTPAVVAATSPLASALGGKSTCPYVPLAPPVPLALVPQTGLLFSNDRLRRPGGHPEIVLSTLQLHLRAMACREGVAQIQAFARANLR
jgi:hypothetical protein